VNAPIRLVPLGALVFALACSNSDTVPHAELAEQAGHATEADRAKEADHAAEAGQAVQAQAVPWAGITQRPAWTNAPPPTYSADDQSGIALTAGTFHLLPTRRRIYFPAPLSSSSGGCVELSPIGMVMPAACGDPAVLILPRPPDLLFDPAIPGPVLTLYFAIDGGPPASAAYRWQMASAGKRINLSDSAGGEDSVNSTAIATTPLTAYSTSADFGPILKSQSWTAYPSGDGTHWTFGGIESLSDLSRPVWEFSFRRGLVLGNGETDTHDFFLQGVAIDYPASR
jgi:hypothetical protein